MREQRVPGLSREEPWWKERLGSGTKLEWMLVGAFGLGFVLFTYQRDGLGKALLFGAALVSSTLISGWWKKREEAKAKEERKPLLERADAERDEHDNRS